MDSTTQYRRVCKLLVYTASQDALDLSDFHIRFAVKRSDTMTPNSADIRVYNLSPDTAAKIRKEFTKVVLQAGYQGNFGVIFQGNIKQILIGRESGTDTYIDIVAGDGDRAYNFAIVNQSLAAGSDANDQIQAASASMVEMGLSQGYKNISDAVKLPRGKVMYGNSRDYIRDIAQSTGQTWSIQDEVIQFVPVNGYLPGERVIINSQTGMIGAPEQTDVGVNVKTLLNPKLRIGGRIELDNDTIQKLKINLTIPNSPSNIPAPLTADGVYYLMVVEHDGDNRGNDWFSNLICFNQDITSNPVNSVPVPVGGIQ